VLAVSLILNVLSSLSNTFRIFPFFFPLPVHYYLPLLFAPAILIRSLQPAFFIVFPCPPICSLFFFLPSLPFLRASHAPPSDPFFSPPWLPALSYLFPNPSCFIFSSYPSPPLLSSSLSSHLISFLLSLSRLPSLLHPFSPSLLALISPPHSSFFTPLSPAFLSFLSLLTSPPPFRFPPPYSIFRISSFLALFLLPLIPISRARIPRPKPFSSTLFRLSLPHVHLRLSLPSPYLSALSPHTSFYFSPCFPQDPLSSHWALRECSVFSFNRIEMSFVKNRSGSALASVRFQPPLFPILRLLSRVLMTIFFVSLNISFQARRGTEAIWGSACSGFREKGRFFGQK